MPEQVRTFLSVYLAKKSVGNAFKEDIYFMDQRISGKTIGGLGFDGF